jgi:predicted RNase H-like HicB family nuclease
MGRQPKKIFFRGYTKKENNHWVAICIDLNIVAQGATAEEAQTECLDLITGYISYVCKNHPNKIDQYIPRQAPQ